MLPFLFSLGTNELVGIKATCPVTCSQCMRSKWSSNDWLDFQGFIDSSLIYQKLTPRQWLLQLHRTKRKYQSNFHLIWSTFKFLRDIWLDINFLSKSWSEFDSLSALHRWNKPPITASAIIFCIFILFLVDFFMCECCKASATRCKQNFLAIDFHIFVFSLPGRIRNWWLRIIDVALRAQW